MALSPAWLDELRARITLSTLVGRSVKLARAGREYKGCCPFHNEKTPSFTVSDEKGFYHCFGCSAHGDAIRWMTEQVGLRFTEAVADLADEAGLALPDGFVRPAGRARIAAAPVRRESVREARDDVPLVEGWEVGKHIFDRCVAARGSIVEAWLRVRGVAPPAGSRVLEQLKFCAAAPVRPWEAGRGPDSVRARPAMVAPIEQRIVCEATGAVSWRVFGVHVTWLSPDGTAKANLRTARKMFGQVQGGVVRLGDWSGPDDGAERGLVEAEGIETTLALMGLRGAARAAAALSLDNLQGFALTRGDPPYLPLWQAEPDLKRAAARWAGERSVVVGVDADMKGMERRVQAVKRGPIAKRALTGRERSELCGALSVAGWRAMGCPDVTAVRPPMGFDFNDMVMGRAAA